MTKFKKNSFKRSQLDLFIDIINNKKRNEFRKNGVLLNYFNKDSLKYVKK